MITPAGLHPKTTFQNSPQVLRREVDRMFEDFGRDIWRPFGRSMLRPF